ncbi:MAG: XRE family transcriptional regulator [Clostridiales bacterium]|jgi:transcriptional regulator with XRE-family HTH domain|nr:XRE family transcriptional regulator [Clostridiales bacterium]
MSEETMLVARRIKELREIFGFSVAGAAKELGVAEAVYERYETSGDDVPISALYKLSKLYNVDTTDLIRGKSPTLTTLSVVKKGEGLMVERFAGYSYENIAFKFAGRTMEPMIVRLLPDGKKPDMVAHGGQEFNFCLKGSMTLYYDGAELTLNAGDAAYFDPRLPHGQACASSEKEAVFLTVINE